MIAVFCAFSGDISLLGLLGDYSKYALHFSEDTYTSGNKKLYLEKPYTYLRSLNFLKPIVLVKVAVM